MSEKRFIACDKWADSEGNIFKFVVIDTKKLGDKQFVLRCNHWSQAQDICNRLNDTLDELREKNEQLRMRLLNCEQKSDNSDFQIWEVPSIPEEERISFITKYGGDDV